MGRERDLLGGTAYRGRCREIPGPPQWLLVRRGRGQSSLPEGSVGQSLGRGGYPSRQFSSVRLTPVR